MLRRALLALAAGAPDPGLFNEEARSWMVPQAKAISAFYKGLGPLGSFEPVVIGMKRKNAYRYRSVFGKTSWLHTFTLDGSGKVADLRLEAESI